MSKSLPGTDELISKAKSFVNIHYQGDYKKAFDAYDSDKDSSITKDELINFLRDIGVGNLLTRSHWARAILDGIGTDKVSWEQFSALINDHN